MTPTQRTLKALRDQGLRCDIVERWIPKKPHGIRSDFIGAFDIIAFSKTAGIIGVQSCGQSFSEHKKKLLAEPRLKDWLESGGKGELWGWRKLKAKRGGKAMRWKPRVADIAIIDGSIAICERKVELVSN